jgi:hypothetical protein
MRRAMAIDLIDGRPVEVLADTPQFECNRWIALLSRLLSPILSKRGTPSETGPK